MNQMRGNVTNEWKFPRIAFGQIFIQREDILKCTLNPQTNPSNLYSLFRSQLDRLAFLPKWSLFYFPKTLEAIQHDRLIT